MALQIIRNNIVNVEADAIVNTANPKIAVGNGVDCAIYTAAGWDRLLEARAEIGEMRPGEAAYTPAFDLRAKYIIHTVGPAWRGGEYGEREAVAECYRNSLRIADELCCESIAFPLIATGTYGFPKDEALRIAMNEISAFLLGHEMEVMLVVYDKESFQVSGKLFSDISAFIGDNDVVESKRSNSSRISRRLFRHRRKASEDEEDDYALEDKLDRYYPMEDTVSILPGAPAPSMHDAERSYGAQPAFPSFPSEEESLAGRLGHLSKTFQEYLFMLIDRKGLTDAEVYKRANIDRKHFSKIRSNVDYRPSKKTALALAIALELSLDETIDLIKRAGLALSPSIAFDSIIEYCIETKNYDIYDINCILFKYDQPTLGA